jgi:hypothetical protein
MRRFVFLLFSVSLFANGVFAHAEILSIQVEQNPNTRQKNIFAYVETLRSVDNMLSEISCVSTPTDITEVSKFEISQPESIVAHYRGKPRLVPLAECFEFGKPIPDEGLLSLLNKVNKVSSSLVFETLPKNIFKINITKCLPERMVALANTPGGESANCFNAAAYVIGLMDMPTDGMEAFSPPLFNREYFDEITIGKSTADLGVIYGSQGNAVHAFVPLGGEIIDRSKQWVFTKDGISNHQPFRFERMSDMLVRYESDGTNVRYFRIKPNVKRIPPSCF